VDLVASVVNRRPAAAVVKTERARRLLERTAGQCFRDVSHASGNADSRIAQQIDHIQRHSNAGIFNELECFAQDAFD